MNTSFLLPNKWKKLGWIFLIIGVLVGLLVRIIEIDLDDVFRIKTLAIWSGGFLGGKNLFQIVENGFLDELISIFVIIGGIMVGFSKTKVEDEFIAQLRLSSLVWSVYLSYAILLFAIIFVYDMAFFEVMLINMFTILLFFIVRFHVQLYKVNRL